MKCNYNGCSSKCKGDINVKSCNVLRAYQQGRADQKKEDNEFFNFECAWGLEKRKSKQQSARDFAEWLKKSHWRIDLSEALAEWQKGTENKNNICDYDKDCPTCWSRAFCKEYNETVKRNGE